MNRVQKNQLVKLVAACEEALQNPRVQSLWIWRGDMRAILGAAKELQRQARKAVR